MPSLRLPFGTAISASFVINRSQYFATLLAVGLAAGHFLFLFVHCPASFPGPDANGYAVHPAANQLALNWGAHTAVTFFLVAGLITLVSWGRSPALWKAVLAGLIIGVIPSLRYAEVVSVIGVALFMAYYIAVERRDRWYDLIAAFAGFAAQVGLLLWRNAAAFGSVRTGGESARDLLGRSWQRFESLRGRAAGRRPLR